MIEPLYTAVGARIARLRERRGLTQEMLGASLTPPLSRASISNFEHGRQRVLLVQLVDLAEALGTTPGKLLRGLNGKAR